jgi:hypothetical protein
MVSEFENRFRILEQQLRSAAAGAATGAATPTRSSLIQLQQVWEGDVACARASEIEMEIIMVSLASCGRLCVFVTVSSVCFLLFILYAQAIKLTLCANLFWH